MNPIALALRGERTSVDFWFDVREAKPVIRNDSDWIKGSVYWYSGTTLQQEAQCI